MLQNKITAFILAGGNSSRMGMNKAFLEIEGKTLIYRLIELLDKIFSSVIISSNEPELYESTGKKIIKDIITGRGPLGGIQSALQFTDTEKIFFISCDMTFVNRELIEFLCQYNSHASVILPKAGGRLQQLCGNYSKRILPAINSLLKESASENAQLKGSIYELLGRIDLEIVDVSGLSFYHPALFFNINTPEDYRHAKNILEQK